MTEDRLDEVLFEWPFDDPADLHLALALYSPSIALRVLRWRRDYAAVGSDPDEARAGRIRIALLNAAIARLIPENVD